MTRALGQRRDLPNGVVGQRQPVQRYPEDPTDAVPNVSTEGRVESKITNSPGRTTAWRPP